MTTHESRKGPWIQTCTGRRFWALDPSPADVDIRDIAHALAFKCRFSGHTRGFYSVAEHSVHASHLVSAHLALTALLHDASEAYLVDLPTPLKQLPEFAEFRRAEARLEHVIALRFRLVWPLPPEVHDVDAQLVAREARALMSYDPDWQTWFRAAPASIKPECWRPAVAKARFLRRFEELQ